MMNLERQVDIWPDYNAVISYGFFGKDSYGERHVILNFYNKTLNSREVIANAETVIAKIMDREELQNYAIAFRRYFLSDIANQSVYIDSSDIVSVVGQPVLDNSRLAVWLYLIEGCSVKRTSGNTTVIKRGAYEHLFTVQPGFPYTDSFKETIAIFGNYIKELKDNDCTLIDNCLRTWLYVHDIDNHYNGMVRARNKVFKDEGLTVDTHFIASTGIEGRSKTANALVMMDAYAVKGIKSGQVKYLKGATHLNPAHEYGVSFERASVVDYGDRRHVFISGTASINNKGEVVHRDDVVKQLERVIGNVSVLLDEAGADFNDVPFLIVYLRDIADRDAIAGYMKLHYSYMPHIILLAPVCRPQWLVEIECLAIRKIENALFPAF
jgi:enamine deaminase RidA (YjgF/YER057c/UK114 family)